MNKRAKRPTRPPPRRRRRFIVLFRRSGSLSLLLVLIIGGCGAVVLGRFPAGQAVLDQATAWGLEVTASLGLVVTDVQVIGRETTDPATIMAALAVGRATPTLGVNPSRAREQLESLPWVRSATIERRLPGTLFVRLVERHPLAVWQHAGKHELIDRDGSVIPIKDFSRFAKLPTVVGDDAAGKAAALLAMLASQPELAPRVTAAIRVDSRRWNLRIDNTTDVLLPEEDPAAAWSHLAALERASSLLQRDIQTVDLRQPDRLVLRVNAGSGSEPAPAKKSPRSG